MKHIGISLITIIVLAGCAANNTSPVINKSVKIPIVKEEIPLTLPPEPKKEIQLKKVEDHNYSSEYMYPESSVKDEVVVPIKTALATESGMNKEECIAMISQEKFDKYTAMFGSEAASIKRCNMLKAMNH